MTGGPDFWRRLLREMPEGAIVAGGAVRDYLLGVEPKDIDVFYPSPAYHAWRVKAGTLGFAPLGDDRREEYAALPAIDIVERATFEGVTVDAIGIAVTELSAFTALGVVQGFDFGITRCWFDANGLHVTDEARNDIAGRKVTLLLTDRLARSQIRFARFNEKTGGDWVLKVAQ